MEAGRVAVSAVCMPQLRKEWLLQWERRELGLARIDEAECATGEK